MIRKILNVLYNGFRFLGNQNLARLLLISPSAKIEIASNAVLNIGAKFRARRNVEINVRQGAEVTIGNNVFLNSGCILTAREKITIGDGTILGPNVLVFDNDHKVVAGDIRDNEYITASIEIGKNVWIGAGSILLKGTVVEDGSIIAAGSVIKGRVGRETLVIQKRMTTERPLKSQGEIESDF